MAVAGRTAWYAEHKAHGTKCKQALQAGTACGHCNMHGPPLHLSLQREGLRGRHRALLKAHHDQFHPVWGQLMKTGYQNSRYAHQIER